MDIVLLTDWLLLPPKTPFYTRQLHILHWSFWSDIIPDFALPVHTCTATCSERMYSCRQKIHDARKEVEEEGVEGVEGAVERTVQ